MNTVGIVGIQESNSSEMLWQSCDDTYNDFQGLCSRGDLPATAPVLARVPKGGAQRVKAVPPNPCIDDAKTSIWPQLLGIRKGI